METSLTLKGRKEQLTYLINLTYILVGIVFILHDYINDYRVDGYWAEGSLREVLLIGMGGLSVILLKYRFLKPSKLITSVSLALIFFVFPIFIHLNYLEMYYINTLLLPVIVLIPSLVYSARESSRLILFLYLFSLVSNFTCEQIVFKYRDVQQGDLDFYNYHFILFSLAKIFTSIFIYVNITHLFKQSEFFEREILNTNEELNTSNLLVNLQKEKIEAQNTELLQREKDLKKLDIAKSHFFANVSHEFRTPLTLLIAPLEKKVNEANNQAEKSELLMMHRNASRLLALVSQLLDLSRMEAGVMKLNLRHGNLGEFVNLVTQRFESLAELKNVVLRISIGRIEMFFDDDKIEKVLTNLLSNAFKFTPAGGWIEVTAFDRPANSLFENGYAEIVVQDSGIGISDSEIHKVFNRFYQVDGSATRQHEGAGIGLSLAKDFVELHGGIIDVDSKIGAGSRFCVSLPIGHHGKSTTQEPNVEQYHGPEMYEGTIELDHPANTKSAPKVLVIEDNADLRIFLAQSLSQRYSVLTASDGTEGMSLTLEHMPDLIVSDLMMPGRDGLELCSDLKNDSRTDHIPYVLLTAKADVESKLKGLSRGADDYIAKPFSMDELLSRIQNLIDGRNKLRKKYTKALEVKPADIKVESQDERFLRKAIDVVEANMSNVQFGVEVFAAEVGMSQTQLYRKLTSITDYSPNEFVRHLRLKRAENLLAQKAGNVAEIAFRVGFQNLSYFSKSFKEKFGVSPSEVEKH